jgi:antitoxin HicB
MTTLTLAYPIELDIEDDGVTVTFPDLPEAITGTPALAPGEAQATTAEYVAAALALAADCLEEVIAWRIASSEDIPTPSKAARGQRVVACPAPVANKAALYLAMRAAGLTRVALAERLGVHEKEVRRMLDPRHATRAERIDAGVRACGHEAVVTLRPLAESKAERATRSTEFDANPPHHPASRPSAS